MNLMLHSVVSCKIEDLVGSNFANNVADNT